MESGSPAIDKGDNAVCAAPPLTGLIKVDQRGVARFRPGDNLCDIGAFEFLNLLVRPLSLLFGPKLVGQQSQVQKAQIVNNQPTSVTLSKIIGGSDPADFIENDNCGTSLAPQASCIISIAFKPAATGNRSAVLTVSDNPDRTSPYHVVLTGVGK